MVKNFIKRFLLIFSAFIIVFTCTPMQSFANDDCRFGRIYIYKPYVNIELYETVSNNIDQCSVVLGDELLEVERASVYDEENDKSLVYLLVDLSTSINQSNFDKLKESLCEFVDDMSKQDEMVLITFGSNITTVLSGNESKSERKKAISKLQANQNQTTFYEALKKVYNMSIVENDKFDRRYLIVVSDGIDLQKGSATKSEVTTLYETHSLPLFALCDESNDSSTVNELGKLARSSGGNVYLYNYSNSQKAVDEIKNAVNNSFIIKAVSSTNEADGNKHKLAVTLDDKQYTQNVYVMNSVVDNVSPVAEIKYNTSEPKCFYVSYSEKVLNAENISSYVVTHNDKKCEIESVEKAKEENKYIIRFKNYIKNGDYVFEFNEITDNSVERNAVASVKLDNLKTSFYKIVVLWSIVIFAVLLFAILVTFILIKRHKSNIAKKSTEPANKNGKEFDYIQNDLDIEVKHKVIYNEKPSIEIILELNRSGATKQTIRAKLFESLIVGRADICDICIDDKQMSRQHFVLQNDKGKVIITDLETTNGTFVNSIKLTSSMTLSQGDEIMSGSCRMKFYSGGFLINEMS